MPYSYNVTALRGQTVTLGFIVNTDDSLNSSFLLDDFGYVSSPTDSIYRLPSGRYTVNNSQQPVESSHTDKPSR